MKTRFFFDAVKFQVTALQHTVQDMSVASLAVDVLVSIVVVTFMAIIGRTFTTAGFSLAENLDLALVLLGIVALGVRFLLRYVMHRLASIATIYAAGCTTSVFGGMLIGGSILITATALFLCVVSVPCVLLAFVLDQDS